MGHLLKTMHCFSGKVNKRTAQRARSCKTSENMMFLPVFPSFRRAAMVIRLMLDGEGFAKSFFCNVPMLVPEILHQRKLPIDLFQVFHYVVIAQRTTQVITQSVL